jgi:large subunit ribosomal protein L7/L12
VSKTEELVQTLSQLSVLELAELKKALEEHWGVVAAAPAAVMAAAPAAAEAPAAEEATEFNVSLVDVPAAKKMGVIKVVRTITGLGLKESKQAVEELPSVLKESVSKEVADDIIKQIEEAGAKAKKDPA